MYTLRNSNKFKIKRFWTHRQSEQKNKHADRAVKTATNSALSSFIQITSFRDIQMLIVNRCHQLTNMVLEINIEYSTKLN